MLQVDKLHQYYGGSHILRGLSFDVKIGEVTCLLGRNGVGKTTLLKCLMGLLPAKEGAVNWEGRAITGLKPHQRVQAGIAYVPQGREIFGRLTVEENLLMGLSRFPGSEAKQVPAFIYELFPILLQMKHRRGGDLSGGQVAGCMRKSCCRRDNGSPIPRRAHGCRKGQCSTPASGFSKDRCR